MKKLEEYLRKGAAELGIVLSSGQCANFSSYAEELCKWNRKINLTSIILPEEIAVKHFLDSLTPSTYMNLSGRLLDVGSGGGFPGIPLKILSPETSVVSVDAVEKKVNFQRHVARTLGLTGFTAIHSRVENLLPEFKETFDYIISRAFADIPEFVQGTLPLLSKNGVIIAMKGRGGKTEANVATAELEKMGVMIAAVHEFDLPILKDQRTLVMIRRF